MSILHPISDYVFPALYCDAIYGLMPTLIFRYKNPTPLQMLVNRRMDSMKIFIENVCAQIFQVFKILNSSQRLTLTNSRGDNQVKTILTCFILLDIRTCLCCMSTDFDVSPVTFEEYLSLNVNFPPAPEVSLPNEFVHSV